MGAVARDGELAETVRSSALGHGGVEPSDLVGATFGEPQGAVGSDDDALGIAQGASGDRVLADELAARGVDGAEAACSVLGEPDVTDRPGHDPARLRTRGKAGAGGRVLGDRAVLGDAAYAIGPELGEPHGAVWSESHRVRLGPG